MPLLELYANIFAWKNANKWPKMDTNRHNSSNNNYKNKEFIVSAHSLIHITSAWKFQSCVYSSYQARFGIRILVLASKHCSLLN